MGKLLIWFGILYGNLVALVGLAVLAVWWTKDGSGHHYCQDLGLSLQGCRGILLVADFVIMGSATFLSFKRLSGTRKDLEKGQEGGMGENHKK